MDRVCRCVRRDSHRIPIVSSCDRTPLQKPKDVVGALPSMFLLRPPSAETLQSLWTEASNESFTYPEVGATVGSSLPPGYRHDRHEIMFVGDPNRFDRAVVALRCWHMHKRSGLRIFPEDQILAPDVTVLVLVRIAFLSIIAPCRVVYVIDEDNRFGFAYGTLPGHPERGEEAFVVERAETGVVRFTVTAFSRPQERLVRMGGPIAVGIQKRATTAYLAAVRDLTDSA